MKRYVWCTNDGGGWLIPLAILVCNEDIAKKLENLNYDNKLKFIAGKLHRCYPNKFPDLFDDYGKTHVFWYNHIIENYYEAYNRMIGERMLMLRNYYNDNKHIRCQAESSIERELKSLPIFVL